MGKKEKEYTDLSKVSLLLDLQDGQQINASINDVVFREGYRSCPIVFGMDDKIFGTFVVGRDGWGKNFTRLTKQELIGKIFNIIMSQEGSLAPLSQEGGDLYSITFVPISRLSRLTLRFE